MVSSATLIRLDVCKEIDKIYKQNSMIHCVIAASVRGWQHYDATDELEKLLDRLHEPKNHNPESKKAAST